MVTRTRGLFIAACVAFVGLGFVGAWFISTEPSGGITGLARFLHFLTSPWMIATEVAAFSFVMFGLWFLGSTPSPGMMGSELEVSINRRGRLLVLVLVLFAMVLAGIGYLFIDDLDATFRQERFSRQRSIANLKAQQIERWLLDYSVHAQLLGASLRQLPLERLPADRQVRQVAEVLFAESLAKYADWTKVRLFAPDGRSLASIGAESGSDDEDSKVAVVAGLEGVDVKIVDVHFRDSQQKQAEMDFVLPIRSDNGKGPVMAVAFIAVDPARMLFEQVHAWPTESASSEVLLVRRDGEEYLLLTSPRFADRSVAALSLRFSLSQRDMPGAQAILLGDGVREGMDYRGVTVLSASRHISTVPWFVIAKTDSAEALRPLHQRTVFIALVIGSVLFVAVLMIVVLWRDQQTKYIAFRDRQAEERAALVVQIEQLVRLARGIVLLTGPDGAIVEANDAAVAAYGYSAEELRRLKIDDLRVQPEHPGVERRLSESVHRRKDGTTFPVEVTGSAFDINGKRFRQSFIHDISKRKALEGELKRISRVQRAMQVANSILLRAKSETELFQKMCDAIIATGGYRMAHVAIAQHDEAKSFQYVAIAGKDDGYLAQAAITWGDTPSGQGPTGIAMKSGAVQVNQDFEANPRMAPWREAALARGYRASISLPLRASGKVFGVLTIYASQAYAFDSEEVALLSDLALDISYGVTALRAQQAVAA